MNFWERESFSEAIDEGLFTVIEHGPLHPQIKGVAFSRDSDGDLFLTTDLEGIPPRLLDYRPGTTFANDAIVRLAGPAGWTATATGVVPISHDGLFDMATSKWKGKEVSILERLEISFASTKKSAYLVEYIGNFKTRFVLPDRTELSQKTEVTLKVRSDQDEITVQRSGGHWGGRDCLHLRIGTNSLFVIMADFNKDSDKGFGCIIYKDEPSETERQKIRDCLSFCFGKLLVYFGFATYDQGWQRVGQTAVNAYSVDRSAYNLPLMPPAPIWDTHEKILDRSRVSKCANALYINYDQFDFLNKFWAYWHALAAPAHMAAVHFGAIIEGLQKILFESRSFDVDGMIMDSATWSKFRLDALSLLESLNLDNQSLENAKTKLDNFNQLPQRKKLSKVFQNLALQLTENEDSAWRDRNNAAHGVSRSSFEFSSVIRNNSLLQTLTNRLILKMSDASDSYCDYYTVGHPIRNLSQGVPS